MSLLIGVSDFEGDVEARLSKLVRKVSGLAFDPGALLRAGRMRQNRQLALVEDNGGDTGRTMRNEIAAIFEQVHGRPVSITDETDIVEDLGMDSLGVMNFVMAIEDFYDLSIPLDRVAQIRTVADLMRTVNELKGGAAA